MTEDEKRRAGRLFDPSDPNLKEQKRIAHHLSMDFNRLYEEETERRAAILAELLGELGEGSFLQGPITFHYGRHTRIGRGCFFNFNLTVQDDADVTVGDRCLFGPNVTIVTPVHPMLPEERAHLRMADGQEGRLCCAKPVRIGPDCWLGASVTICPGVTIGAGCVIGAGSVVTRNIPTGSFAAGVPCRVVRTLTEQDSIRRSPEVLGDAVMSVGPKTPDSNRQDAINQGS